MGLCEKCDDRASGRLDCDLTSERERKTREREGAREGKEEARKPVRAGEDRRTENRL